MVAVKDLDELVVKDEVAKALRAISGIDEGAVVIDKLIPTGRGQKMPTKSCLGEYCDVMN